MVRDGGHQSIKEIRIDTKIGAKEGRARVFIDLKKQAKEFTRLGDLLPLNEIAL
jgi:hypothetical protein